MIFSFDTETFRIRPGLQAPPVVCVQYAFDDQRPEVIHGRDPALRGVLEYALRHCTINGHNLAFDAAVIVANFPELTSLMFEAYHVNRATCTAIRHKLHDIARGHFRGIRGSDRKFVKQWKYGLGDCIERMTKGEIVLDKADPWRIAYGSLYHLPVSQWPEPAISYALGDVNAQRTLYFGQEGFHPAELVDQFRQARAAFWIRLMECWGAKTDPEAVERYHGEIIREWEEDKTILINAGLVRRDGTKDTKAAMSRMVWVCGQLGISVTLTDTGETLSKESGIAASDIFRTFGKGICLDADATEASADDVLEGYSRFSSLSSTLSKVERLRRGFVTPLQARYETIMETGRTSCTQGDDPEPDADGILWEPPQWGSQMQNPPKKKGIRECYVAREGYDLCSVDFDGKELRTWAQVCLWAVGRSRMAEILNSGEDPHTDLGGRLVGISRDEARAIRKGLRSKADLEAFESFARQTAKIGNFGFPGGMGAAALVAQAWSIYRVKIGLDPTNPGAWTPERAIAYAKFLKKSWGEEWPESADYFSWVNWLVEQGDGSGATIRHFVSERLRGSIPYTVTCNSFFQGLAADSAKAAGWELARAMYLAERGSPLFGSRLVAFVHDEFIAEIPNASREQRHAASYEMARIMIDTAQQYVPDVKITASPALMKHWSKKAKTAHDSSGLLIPYEEAAT